MAGLRAPIGGAGSCGSATSMAMPKLRCGATTSSISADSGMRSNGSPVGELGQLGQDVAAALRLLAQQPHVVGVRRVRLERALQLLGDHRDGRERRAELVRGGGRKPVELRQMLLARQHQFGRGQRLGDLPAFLGDLPRIDADEADREQDREPDAEQIDPRQLERIVGVPRQRIMREHQHGRAHHGERAEHAW